MDKPKVQFTGKAVIEYAQGEWLAMTPDGAIRPFVDPEGAAKHVQRWFNRAAKKAGDAINVGTITWQHYPESFKARLNALGVVTE